MALHTIREADLKTHVDKDGWNSDINYEDYLCRKIYENKLNNIKLKYKIDKYGIDYRNLLGGRENI